MTGPTPGASSASRRCASRRTSRRCGPGWPAGLVDTVCTDHAPWSLAAKLDPALSIERLRPGVENLQVLLPMLYSEGVRRGRISLQRLVDVTSANAARLFGLYPQKGALAVGSDADLVIFDPELERTVTAACCTRTPTTPCTTAGGDRLARLSRCGAAKLSSRTTRGARPTRAAARCWPAVRPSPLSRSARPNRPPDLCVVVQGPSGGGPSHRRRNNLALEHGTNGADRGRGWAADHWGRGGRGVRAECVDRGHERVQLQSRSNGRLAGRDTFTLQNAGMFPHNLHIEGNGVSVDVKAMDPSRAARASAAPSHWRRARTTCGAR